MENFGNIISDNNKGISCITYNHLNLPTLISFPSQSAVIEYVYDATGVKQKKKVSGFGMATTETDYAGNYIYENNTLQFSNHLEGYTKYDSGKVDFIYQYKDHLGNVRLSYSDSDDNGSIDMMTEIIEESNYYPFGLQHRGYNNVITSNGNSSAQKFKFNGVEYEESLGLNLYEMDWRGYDASLGRFMQIDPHAETYFEWSGYHFSANNPVFVADPDGQDWIITMNEDKEGNITYNVTINMAVMNSSKKNFDMEKTVETVKDQITRAFSVFEKNENGGITSVNVTANIRAIDDKKELGDKEHLLEIKDKVKHNGEEVMGKATIFGLKADITANVMYNAMNNNDNSTIGHEIGHTGGLYHPDDHGYRIFGFNFGGAPKKQRLKAGEDDDNIMFSGSYQKTILRRTDSEQARINSNQASILYKNYKKGKLNKRK